MNQLTKLFPLTVIVLQIMAAIVYGYVRDWRHAAFWWSVAVANIAVTF